MPLLYFIVETRPFDVYVYVTYALPPGRLILVMSLWLVLAYYRERLFLDDNSVTQQGVRRIKRIPLDQITEIEWREDYRHGSIVV